MDSATHVAAFLRAATPDWRVGGPRRAMAYHAAGRLLRRHPGIARHDLLTAVVCGEVTEVARRLDADPALANRRAGVRHWPPLLYLCAARLPHAPSADHAVEIARLLLVHGADPNAYTEGGDASIHYTALTLVLGRGEERAAPHPRARALARLLMERGASPYDVQVLYNVLGDHDSRRPLSDDDVWLLDLMHEISVRHGHGADWDAPEWRMLDMGGYGHGAYYLLHAAVAANLPGLATWMLAHGASPNAAPPVHPRVRWRPLLLEAERRGLSEMTNLLRRHGATPGDTAATTPPTGEDAWVEACFRLDRGAMRTMLAQHPELARAPRALHAAARRDRADVVEALLAMGTSPEVEHPQSGIRALHAAASHDAVRAMDVLLAHGAAVDPRERQWGATPLWFAVWSGCSAAASRLAPVSRDVWSLVALGEVARLRAVLAEDPSLARGTGEHETPLMYLPDDEAAAREIAALLVRHGADLSVRDERGLTAAELAAERGMDDVAALLRAAAP